MAFVRLTVGDARDPVLVNADCRANILLDYCKHALLRGALVGLLRGKCDAAATSIRVLEDRVKMAAAAAAGTTTMDGGDGGGGGDAKTAEGEDGAAAAAAAAAGSPDGVELAQWREYVDTLRSAIATLTSDGLEVDFAEQDGGASANLRSALEEQAQETLTPKGSYQLMCFPAAGGGGESGGGGGGGGGGASGDPVSVLDLCSAVSPAETRAAAEAAAAEEAKAAEASAE